MPEYLSAVPAFPWLLFRVVMVPVLLIPEVVPEMVPVLTSVVIVALLVIPNCVPETAPALFSRVTLAPLIPTPEVPPEIVPADVIVNASTAPEFTQGPVCKSLMVVVAPIASWPTQPFALAIDLAG